MHLNFNAGLQEDYNRSINYVNAQENIIHSFTHEFSVYITYDDRNSGSCSYFGNGSATNCP